MSAETASGRELEALLDPIRASELIAEHWGKRYLFIPAGARKQRTLPALLDRATFTRAAARLSKVTATFAPGTTQRMKPRLITADQIDAIYAKSGSICANRLETALPRLAEYVLSLKRRLGYSGEARCAAYLSPDGTGATNTHFDAVHAFIVQTEGEKEWRVSRAPVMDHPPVNGDLSGFFIDAGAERWAGYARPDLRSLQRVVLRPGDVLYLAPGTWHYARARGHSLALTIAFRYNTYGRTAQIVFETLVSLLESRPGWRGAPPLGLGGAKARRAWFEQRLQELEVLVGDERALALLMQHVWRRHVIGAPAPAPK